MTNEEKLNDKLQIMAMYDAFLVFSPLSKKQETKRRHQMLSEINKLKNIIRLEKLRKINGN